MKKLKEIVKIRFGKKIFYINVSYQKRKTVAVSVYPDKRIIAKFPIQIKKHIILDFLNRKVKWINKKIEYYDQFHPLPTERKYISGESYYYLGRQYQLNIEKSKNEYVKMKHSQIIVYTKEPKNREQVKKLLNTWYKEHAINYISIRIEKIMPLFEKENIPKPRFRFRKMKSKWGTCRVYNDKGKQSAISINTELIRAPQYCIDYVIIHELVHLKYINHNKQFYRMLERFLPDWEKRKERLKFVYIID